MKTFGQNCTWVYLIVEIGQNWSGIRNLWLPTDSRTLTKLWVVCDLRAFIRTLLNVFWDVASWRLESSTPISEPQISHELNYKACLHTRSVALLLVWVSCWRTTLYSIRLSYQLLTFFCGILLILSCHEIVECVVCFVWILFFSFHWLYLTSSSLLLITMN